jgi:hypothetical protein
MYFQVQAFWDTVTKTKILFGTYSLIYHALMKWFCYEELGHGKTVSDSICMNLCFDVLF